MIDNNCVIDADEFSTFEEQIDSPMEPIQTMELTHEEEQHQQILNQQSALNTIFTEEGLTDNDMCILLNMDLFNSVIKDSQSVSMRTLTRDGGTLHEGSNNDEFVQQFDRLYGTMSNSARKKRIRKLLKANPCLLSADPELVRRRIFAFERMCNLKKEQ